MQYRDEPQKVDGARCWVLPSKDGWDRTLWQHESGSLALYEVRHRHTDLTTAQFDALLAELPDSCKRPGQF